MLLTHAHTHTHTSNAHFHYRALETYQEWEDGIPPKALARLQDMATAVEMTAKQHEKMRTTRALQREATAHAVEELRTALDAVESVRSAGGGVATPTSSLAPANSLVPLVKEASGDAKDIYESVSLPPVLPPGAKRPPRLDPLSVDAGESAPMPTSMHQALLEREANEGARNLSMGTTKGIEWAVTKLKDAVALVETLKDQLERKRQKKRMYAVRALSAEVAVAKLSALDTLSASKAARAAGREIGWDPLARKSAVAVARAENEEDDQDLIRALKRQVACLQTSLCLRDNALRALADSEVRRDVLDRMGATPSSGDKEGSDGKAFAAPTATSPTDLKAVTKAVVKGMTEEESEVQALAAELMAERSFSEAQSRMMAGGNLINFDRNIVDEANRPDRANVGCEAISEEIDHELRILGEISAITAEREHLQEVLKAKMAKDEAGEYAADWDVVDEYLEDIIDDVVEETRKEEMEEEIAKTENFDVDYSMLCEDDLHLQHSPTKRGSVMAMTDAMFDIHDHVSPRHKSYESLQADARSAAGMKLLTTYRRVVMVNEALQQMRRREAVEQYQATF